VPKDGAATVTRAEFNAVIAIINTRGDIINDIKSRLEASDQEIRRILDIQFQRIAQLQAELDEVRRAWTRTKPR
jgi:hypothetical protein